MKRTVFIATAFALHLLIGNLCLNGMPFARAIGTSTDGPIFSRDITQCPLINKSVAPIAEEPIEEERESPCATGNCFKPPHAPTVCTPYGTMDVVTTAIIDTSSVLIEFPVIHSLVPHTHERPPPLIAVRTVVLRS